MRMHVSLFILVMSLSVLTLQPAFSQEPSARQVQKDLKKLMKELPLETQQRVLQYAQRQQVMLQSKKPQVKPEQMQAKPAPKPAAPQAITLKPEAKPATATPTKPAQPARPAYMVEAESMKPTTVDWGEINHDFGQVSTGETVRHTYRFTNTGDAPLKLTRVKASCGCTTPSWSKEPIDPGKEGFIEVAFNTRGKKGAQRKTVMVTGNFQPTNMVLRFQADVQAAAEKPSGN